MRAVDTNILARYIVGDDPDQSPRATAVLATPCFVSDTVLLETAWLLSSRFDFDRADLAATLQDIIQLPSLTVSDRIMMRWAIERFAAGADFADMMHLVGARHADVFISFETRLKAQAGPDTPIEIEQPA
ncbi:type II toxin-antitoxin system VapC family toxin [Sphingomonas sp.]|uniref:type II toxin-antitoxin system VapC family toxin n=1 Tax=Sphingomonas sp. TaxID=28214 RepID=UPI003AFF8195